MCKLHLATRVKKKRMRERNGCLEIYTCVVGSGDDSMQTYCTFLVCFMSFFFFFFLVVDVVFSPLRCPHIAFTTHTLPPTSNALLFAFFFLLACVRAFVFSSFFLLSFFSISRVYANTSTLGDLTIELDVEEKGKKVCYSYYCCSQRKETTEKRKIACLHNYI